MKSVFLVIYDKSILINFDYSTLILTTLFGINWAYYVLCYFYECKDCSKMHYFKICWVNDVPEMHTSLSGSIYNIKKDMKILHYCKIRSIVTISVVKSGLNKIF